MVSRYLLGILLMTLGIVSQPDVAWAQDTATVERQGMPAVIADDALRVLKDARSVVLGPLTYEQSNWRGLGFVLGGTLALFAVDEPTRKLAIDHNGGAYDGIANLGREYGREIYGLTAAAGFYLAGLVIDDQWSRETGVLLVESIVFSGVVTSAAKTLLGRSRPFAEEGNLRFRLMQFRTATTSLPSGHATVAFAVSTVLAGRFKNVYASIILYSLATITSLSRLYHDAHWISDVFLGSAIGACVGWQVLALHDEATPNVVLTPSAYPLGVSVKLQM